MQRQVNERATSLARSAGHVREQTSSVAEATEQIASSVAELSRVAELTEGITITVTVVDRAEAASAAMRALEESSTDIMAVADIAAVMGEFVQPQQGRRARDRGSERVDAPGGPA